MADRPNVLAFCVDEMRADHMGCAGKATVQTPNLDRIAAAGTMFRRAMCNNPICMPARASMFTGLLPRDHGVRANGHSLRRDLPVLPQILADAGYRTHAAGKLHMTPWVPKVAPPDVQRYPECRAYWNNGDIREFPVPYYGFQTVGFVGGHTAYAYGPYIGWLEEQGGNRTMLTSEKALQPPSGAPSCYKMSLPEELHYNRYVADSTIRLIEESAQEAAPPFFAWCSFPDPHCPIAPPAPYANMYDPQDVPLPARREGEIADLPPVYRRVRRGEFKPYGSDNTGITDDHWREMIALTYGMVTHIDAEIGRVLDALERTGQMDNTIVIFTSDHGDMMGDHGLIWKGFYTFRGCIDVPMIVSAPGFDGGRVCEALVSQIDLLPSVLDLCAIPMPGADWPEDGNPFERGNILPIRPYPGRSWRGLLDGSTDAIRETVVIENDDPPTGCQVRALVTPEYRLTVYPGTEDGELFDRRDDPDEMFNLWYDSAHRKLRTDLTLKLLADYSRDTPLYPVPPWNS